VLTKSGGSVCNNEMVLKHSLYIDIDITGIYAVLMQRLWKKFAIDIIWSKQKDEH